MPTYEYRCEGCKKVYEVICSYQEKEAKKPTCNCDDPYIKQIITNVSVRKGPSWGPGKGHWIQLLTGGLLWESIVFLDTLL